MPENCNLTAQCSVLHVTVSLRYDNDALMFAFKPNACDSGISRKATIATSVTDDVQLSMKVLSRVPVDIRS